MSTMYNTDRYVSVKNTIAPTSCMYGTDRLIKSHFSSASGEPMIAQLESCEQALDAAIEMRRLNKSEAEIDRCLGQLDQELLKKAAQAANSQKKSAGKTGAAGALAFGDNRVSQLDVLMQISPNYNPKMTLKTISQLVSAGKKVMVRQHLHSSVAVEKAQAVNANFAKCAKQCQIVVNTEPGRATTSYDFIFTFLITDKLNTAVCNMDATIHASQYSSIMGDSNVAKMIFDVAGGAVMSDVDHFWCDMIAEALSDNSQLKSVKSQIEKNFSSTGGFADIAKLCL